MEAPGSGHKGSVDCERATGNNHWNPLSTNFEVRFLNVYVITLPMYAFLLISLSESFSRGLGVSVNVMLSWVNSCLLSKGFISNFSLDTVGKVIYKFFMKKAINFTKIISLYSI